MRRYSKYDENHLLRGELALFGACVKDKPQKSQCVSAKISDQDIVAIIGFTQNAFAKVGKGISADEVKKLRDKKPLGGGLFNEKQLLENVFER